MASAYMFMRGSSEVFRRAIFNAFALRRLGM
jgi:hypothetical protein